MRGSCWRRVPARCARPAPPSLARPAPLHGDRSRARLAGAPPQPAATAPGSGGGPERPRRAEAAGPQRPGARALPRGRSRSGGRRRREAPAPRCRGPGPWRSRCCSPGWQVDRGTRPALCEAGCKFGECVGPNKCRCFPGYTGKTCSQDVNECGLKPRPCQHRCVNTHGSYKCFCLSSHVLMPDATCANSRTCAMTSCQYSCEDTEEGPRCLCPSSGLRLAPNGRVCTDIDECASGKAVCPYHRRCVNTFGSYYCKCHVGFELKYVRGRYDCVDINECAGNTHPCSLYANCLNTQGSFKCECKQGYRGNGLQCSVIPENSVKEVLTAPGTIKDRIKKLLAHKNSMKKKTKMKNVITEPSGAPAPEVNLQPLNSEESVSRGRNSDGGKNRNEERKKEGLEEKKRKEKTLKNHVEREQSLRGDVFSPKVNAAGELGLVLVQRKAVTSRLEHKADLNISVDCSFEHGVCDWKQDIEDDFDWNPADRDNAVGYYMAVPALAGRKKDIGRLKLLLPDLQPQSNFCLLFDYRLAGDKVGKLRVFVKSSNNALAWEETRSKDERWKTGKIQLEQGISTTKSIIFEAERGRGKAGEIAVDGVFLVSGLCPDRLLSVHG
ncbi:epidermal growth factor-like protein 6 isoform X3 [Acinonyx jubatus]|uniref:Epidermal growth factor-like protein 6 isoform X3 n=1 Tax=Acinonyx jubatus TaxID=32536 RepID=A0ABM3NF48_ACIJB|nr:epidermal growth factor-like protein 6 isoform X3 [Acinonyx jubatus]